MYLLPGIAAIFVVVVLVPRLRVAGTWPDDLGHVSQQWLAKYRASQPSRP